MVTDNLMRIQKAWKSARVDRHVGTEPQEIAGPKNNKAVMGGDNDG